MTMSGQGEPPSALSPNRRVTRADQAMTELCEHREWLRSTRCDRLDDARIVGISEAMDILAKHGARCTCPSAEPRRAKR